MSMLGQMFNRIAEAQAGRIRWRGNMWAKVGSRWDRKRVVNRGLIGGRAEINERGEWVRSNGITLVSRLCIVGCPQPPGDDFFVGDDGKAWVPATECRKCPHHRAADRTFRFPRCTYGKAVSAKDVAANTIAAVRDLVAEAKEITGRR